MAWSLFSSTESDLDHSYENMAKINMKCFELKSELWQCQSFRSQLCSRLVSGWTTSLDSTPPDSAPVVVFNLWAWAIILVSDQWSVLWKRAPPEMTCMLWPILGSRLLWSDLHLFVSCSKSIVPYSSQALNWNAAFAWSAIEPYLIKGD